MRRFSIALAAVISLFAAAHSLACSVPVFRYALDHWRADNYRLELPAGYAKDDALAAFTRNLGADSPLNLEVTTLPTGEATARLRFPHDENAGSGVWSGTLDATSLAKLTNSPARREIVHRILTGESVVWVLVESGDRAADDTIAQRVAKRLAFLESIAQLPRIDPSDPDSKLGPGPALRAKFSLLRVPFIGPSGTVSPPDGERAGMRGADPEFVFLKMLAGPKADASLASGPWLAAVFGRGRVLGVWPAESFGDNEIEETCLFLLGACSCQVKRQNPGWDLLLCVDWDKELAAAAVTASASSEPKLVKEKTATPPETVTIIGSEANDTGSRNNFNMPVLVGALLLGTFGWVAWQKLRNQT